MIAYIFTPSVFCLILMLFASKWGIFFYKNKAFMSKVSLKYLLTANLFWTT
jgi:hypothetical protein